MGSFNRDIFEGVATGAVIEMGLGIAAGFAWKALNRDTNIPADCVYGVLGTSALMTYHGSYSFLLAPDKDKIKYLGVALAAVLGVAAGVFGITKIEDGELQLGAQAVSSTVLDRPVTSLNSRSAPTPITYG